MGACVLAPLIAPTEIVEALLPRGRAIMVSGCRVSIVFKIAPAIRTFAPSG
jgi:hypothetical protein